MRDLQAYGKICMEILEDLAIPHGTVAAFTVNTRARRWGQCRKISDLYYININQTLLDERNDESGLVNTILHELLHTCPGCMNHGAAWKKYAEIVRKNWGYDVKRVSSEEEKGVTTGNQNYREREYKYLIYCEKCGKLVARKKRRCNLVEHPCLYIHGTECRGKLYLVDLEKTVETAAEGED